MKIRKLLIYTALMWALILPFHAQAAPVSSGIFVIPEVQLFDDAGAVCNGCLVYFYIAGTTSARDTYTTRQLNVANANPVVLDSAGRAEIYLKSDNAYKVKLMDSGASTTYWTIDNVTGAGSHYIGDIDGDTLVEVEVSADSDTIKLSVAGNQKITINAAMDFWKGITRRANFTYIDANTITINPGMYEINGKLIFWDSALTSADIGTPTASTWVYLYLDDSDIGTASKEETDTSAPNTLDWSETAPTYSAALHGYYNGNDRAIFMVYSDGSSNITVFQNDGSDYVLWDEFVATYTGAIGDSFADIGTALLMPGVSTRAEVYFKYNYVNTASKTAYWRVDGSSSTNGTPIAAVTTSTLDTIGQSVQTVFAVAGIIELRDQLDSGGGGGGNTITVNTVGWYLPNGM